MRPRLSRLGGARQPRSGLIAPAVIGIASVVALISPLVVASASASDGAASTVVVDDLNVNGRFGEVLGLGDVQPTLAWRMTAPAVEGDPCVDDTADGVCALDRQTSYQIEAASGAASRSPGEIVWDSGKVDSAEQSVRLGVELAPREDIVWRVRVWDANGDQSPWSEPSRFSVGLIDASDWTAEWIEDPQYTYQTDGEPNLLPVFARAFGLEREVTAARLYATGLGQYSATLNGSPLGDAVLEPGQTSYWAEVNYRTYDVSALLRAGENVLGFEVGSGVYQQADTTPMGRYNFQPEHKEVMGQPKVKAQLELTYADGEVETIATDDSWAARAGGTTFSSWWGGEDYDGRVLPTGWTSDSAVLDGDAWHQARTVHLNDETIPRADTPLVADPRPPVTVVEEAVPVSITEQRPAAVQTALVAGARVGDDTLRVATTTGVFAGDGVEIAGERHTVTAVGIGAKTSTALTSAVAAGDTTVAVAAVGRDCYAGAVCEGTENFVVGQSLTVGNGAEAETVTVSAVTRDRASVDSPGIVTVAPAFGASHAQGAPVRGAGTGITVSPGLTADLAEGTALTTSPRPAYVLDFGRNLVGLPQIAGRQPAGTTVSLLGSEQPTPPTDLDSVRQAGIYRYTFAGSGDEVWRSQFTYNGQRYVVVRGLDAPPPTEMVTLLVTHAANEQTSSFGSCDPMLGAVYDITERALQGNMLSVLTDCPNREKGPYTGDNLHNIDAELTMYDMRAYQHQLVANMRTSQRPTPISEQRQPGKYEGMIANIAPEFHAVPDALYNGRWFLDEPNWGGAIIRIPWDLYRVYGDDSAMAPNYDAMVEWLDYVGRSKQDNPSGEINGLGDWSAGQVTTPAEAIIDIGYYEGARVLALVADHLGKDADAEKYRALAADLKDEYNVDYLHVDAESGRAWYASDTQASNAVALDSGLVPDEYRDEVFASLVRAVEAFDFRLSHGSVGGGAVFRMLHEGGRDDLLYRMVTNPHAPSYAFQVNRGQTTLAENLSGGSSQNHHFLGQVNSWLVHDLAGIAQPADSVGYRTLQIRPAIGAGVDDIPCVSATYTTPAGQASSEVLRDEGRVSVNVTVPANTSAEVWVPRADGHGVDAPRRAAFLRDEAGYAVYRVGAGTFSFVSGEDAGGPIAAAASITPRIVGPRVQLSVTVRNEDTVPIVVRVASEFASKTFRAVRPGAEVSVTLNTRQASVTPGTVSVRLEAVRDGRTETEDLLLGYGAYPSGR